MLQISHFLIHSVQIEQISLPLYATHYVDDQVPTKATLIYLHGGGLLAGSSQDLPERHIQFFTQAGIQILALDYPLAPHTKVDGILISLLQSIDIIKKQPLFAERPYFLWGRSAGAYLALLIATKLKQQPKLPTPAGILSFYGYGFLTDGWYEVKSDYYTKLPTVNQTTFNRLTEKPLATTDSQHFAIYIYARQTGLWKSLIYQGRDKFFYLDYSLRLSELNFPLFLAHATGDPDVPFAEFNALCAKFSAERFIAATNQHDFDRNQQSELTEKLLQASLDFMLQSI